MPPRESMDDEADDAAQQLEMQEARQQATDASSSVAGGPCLPLPLPVLTIKAGKLISEQ